MPSRPSPAATLAARTLLRGPLEAQPVANALLSLGGQPMRRVQRLAERVAARFGDGRRPRWRDVAAFLDAQATFAIVPWSTLGATPPATMQPAAGAPRTWTVPAIVSLAELAAFLRLDERELAALRAPTRRCSGRESPRFEHYHHHWIARRGGVPRLVEAPKPRLKAVQRRILQGILANVPAHAAAHGFVAGRGVASFVAPHTGRTCVLRMDVADFFASLRRARVLRVFLATGYPEEVAAALADLCTTATPPHVCDHGLGVGRADALRHRLLARHLPQGAPTSPALANLCAVALDARLHGLASRFAAVYTRYADDLLFSGGPSFARDAARCEVHAAAILLECGLQAAHRKTKIMRQGVAQRAAGVVLNVHAAVPRRERERLEAVLWNCVRTGPAAQNRDGHSDFRAYLLGRIAWCEHVHAPAAARLRALFARIDWSAAAPC